MSVQGHSGDPQQAAADQLAATLERMALALRLGRVPNWAVESCSKAIAMVQHVLCGPRGRFTNVTELAPWARQHDGAENARQVIATGSLRKG